MGMYEHILIQSVKTVYGGVACQTNSPVVTLRNMDTRGVIHPLKGPHGDHDSLSSLSTNGHNSDIADMGDFSDGEVKQWEEVETSVRTSVCTSSNDASSSSERSELPKSPTVVTPHDMEIHDENYWTNFRFLAKQAFKLDNVELAASDYPVAVKELVVRSRVTIQDINDRADRWFAEQQELEAAGETVASDFWYSDMDRLEDFTIPVRDWCHKRSPIIHDQATDTAYRSVENADEAGGQDVTLAMDSLADNADVCSDPDARAKFELSPTKHVIALENIGLNCASDGDVTVMGENVAGDTVAHEGEYIRVSMISVDEHRTVTSVYRPDSLGIRDCALPECGTRPILAAYEDSALCVRESLPNMTTSCFGLCGSTNQFHNTGFEWCVECVNRLLWGFIVSCVVSIVGRDQNISDGQHGCLIFTRIRPS